MYKTWRSSSFYRPELRPIYGSPVCYDNLANLKQGTGKFGTSVRKGWHIWSDRVATLKWKCCRSYYCVITQCLRICRKVRQHVVHVSRSTKDCSLLRKTVDCSDQKLVSCGKLRRSTWPPNRTPDKRPLHILSSFIQEVSNNLNFPGTWPLVVTMEITCDTIWWQQADTNRGLLGSFRYKYFAVAETPYSGRMKELILEKKSGTWIS